MQAEAGQRQVTIAEAAALFGVSADTIKRRVRSGALRGMRDARGRILVDVPEDDARQVPRDASHLHGAELLVLRERLAATAAERDWLRERVELAETEREQLRILLGSAQQHLARALPPAPYAAPHERAPGGQQTVSAAGVVSDDLAGSSAAPRRAWWRFW